MIRYVDPEGEDTSKVRKRVDPRRRSEKIARRREENAQLPDLDALESAREYALRVLDRSAVSRGTLAQKLAQRGYRETVIEALLTRFEEVGLLDDMAYARALVRSRHFERGLVGPALRQELYKKHLPPEIIDTVLAQMEDEVTPADTAYELALGKARRNTNLSDQVRKRRIVSFLQRKGYSPGICFEATAKALDEYPSEVD